MTPDPKALIAEIMAATGLTLEGIAEKIGLSERSVRNVYYKQSPLTARNLALLEELRARGSDEALKKGDVPTPKTGVADLLNYNLGTAMGESRRQAEYIQAVMQARSLSIEELAARLLVSPDKMQKYASGALVAPERLMFAVRAIAEGKAPPQKKPVRILKEMRPIPVISRAQAGHLGTWEELPTEWQRSIPSDCPDPHAFALELEGDSMEPLFKSGDIVIVMPSFKPYNESLVVAKLSIGDVSFKRMVFDDPSGQRIQLISYNPLYPSRTIETEHDLEWIYPVYSMARNLWNEERWKSQHQAVYGAE